MGCMKGAAGVQHRDDVSAAVGFYSCVVPRRRSELTNEDAFATLRRKLRKGQSQSQRFLHAIAAEKR